MQIINDIVCAENRDKNYRKWLILVWSFSKSWEKETIMLSTESLCISSDF